MPFLCGEPELKRIVSIIAPFSVVLGDVDFSDFLIMSDLTVLFLSVFTDLG